jgi:hypothetical protein
VLFETMAERRMSIDIPHSWQPRPGVHARADRRNDMQQNRRNGIAWIAALAGQFTIGASAAQAQPIRSFARVDSTFTSTVPDPGEFAPQASGSHWLLGAGIGFVAGGTATWLVLNHGDSTAPCDRDANQDALSGGQCLGLVAAGALVGAGIGALAGRLFRTDPVANAPLDRLRIGWMPRTGGRIAVSLPF